MLSLQLYRFNWRMNDSMTPGRSGWLTRPGFWLKSRFSLHTHIFTYTKYKSTQRNNCSVWTKCVLYLFLKIKLYLSQPNLNDLFMRGKYIPIVGKHRSYWNEIHYLIMRNNDIVMKSRYRRDWNRNSTELHKCQKWH